MNPSTSLTISAASILAAFALAPSPSPTAANLTPAGPLAISREAGDLIVYYETGGKAYYESRLRQPTVPPGASGVTIGIGYDLGYNTAGQIGADWTGAIPAAHVARLQTVAGRTGASARTALARVRDIIIPWEAARTVYERKTVPRFGSLAAAAFPGVTHLHPSIQGVILSTVFNRGTSMTGDRRREMRASRDDIAAGRTDRLPGHQLAMRRLWPTIAGLQKRYAAHAAMIERANQTTPR